MDGVYPFIGQPKRNPILRSGEVGQEYNCLYTTKELSCKPIKCRDPITLTGDLGPELDLLRSHGGRPRSCILPRINRDPITGTGDFGREWDPIYKYNGRAHINRPVMPKTDPIAHSASPRKNENNLAYGTKHFTNAYASRDLIGHTNDNLQEWPESPRRGMKHFPDQWKRQVDLGFTKQQDLATPNQIIKRSPREQSNILTHSRPQTSRSVDKLPTKPWRDPITGRGMTSEDYIDLLKLPKTYSFRHSREGDGSGAILNSAPYSTSRKGNFNSVRSPVRQSLPSRLPKSTEKQAQPAEEKPLVKKVIRPKPKAAEDTSKMPNKVEVSPQSPSSAQGVAASEEQNSTTSLKQQEPAPSQQEPPTPTQKASATAEPEVSASMEEQTLPSSEQEMKPEARPEQPVPVKTLTNKLRRLFSKAEPSLSDELQASGFGVSPGGGVGAT